MPAGATAGDVVLAAVSTWGTSAPTVTAPAGFTLKASYTGASANGGTDTTRIYWKRLTAADTGSYRFTWSGSRWSSGHAIAVSGAAASGDPIAVISRANSASASTFPTTSVTTTAASLLTWFGRNDEPAPGTHTAAERVHRGAGQGLHDSGLPARRVCGHLQRGRRELLRLRQSRAVDSRRSSAIGGAGTAVSGLTRARGRHPTGCCPRVAKERGSSMNRATTIYFPLAGVRGMCRAAGRPR